MKIVEEDMLKDITLKSVQAKTILARKTMPTPNFPKSHYIYIYIYIYKVKLATVDVGDPKGPFSIAKMIHARQECMRLSQK